MEVEGCQYWKSFHGRRRSSGRRAPAVLKYIEFIEGLKGDQAGRLEAGEGETPRTVRRRLGDAGRLIGTELVIKKVGDVAYFWLKARRGRGTPRKSCAVVPLFA